MDVADARVGPAEAGVQGRVVEAILVQLVEAEGDVEGRSPGIAVLTEEIVEEPVGTDREVPDTPLEEIPGERRLRTHDQVGGLGPAAGLSEIRAEPAEILLVGALVGAQLCDGEAEHARNVHEP